MNSAAWRLPKVIVPVLSSSRVVTSPAASTARPDIASTLRCTRRSMPAMPMADSSAADRGRDQAHEQGDEHDDRLLGLRVDGEGLQRHDGQQEDDREPGQQDRRGRSRSGSSAGRRPRRGRSCGRGTSRPASPVIRTTISSDSTRVPPVTAERSPPRLADDRGRLAGDRRLVDGGDALDDVAVAGDHLAGGHHAAGRRCASCVDGTLHDACRRAGAPGPRSRLGSCAAWRPAPCRGPRPWPRRSWRTAR